MENREELEHTVEEALGTILAFERSIEDVEVKAGELFHLLENQDVDPAPLYEMFRIFSGLHFQMAEAHEYQALLKERRVRVGKCNGGPRGHLYPPPEATPRAPAEQTAALPASGRSHPRKASRKWLQAGLISRLITSSAFCGGYLRALLGVR